MPLPGLKRQGSWPCPSPKGGSASRGLGWSTQLPSRPITQYFELANSNIYLSMTSWNIWRNQFCLAITTNLHYSGQQQEYLSKRSFVRVQYWQCTRRQRLWTRQTTYCNGHLQLKQIRQKGILCNTQQLPRPPWQRICDGDGGKIEEQSGFLLSFVGENTRVEGAHGRPGSEWDWDARCEIPKRINRKTMLTKRICTVS